MSTLALAMCIPAIADAAAGNPDWQVFAGSATLTLFIGVMLMLTMRSTIRHLTLHQAFVLTTLCWIVTPTLHSFAVLLCGSGLELYRCILRSDVGRHNDRGHRHHRS